MPGLVEGKAGLVTGSAGGIGRATALALAREGAAGVLVTDLPSRQEDGEETVRLIEQEGGHAVFVPGDVSVAADCAKLVRHTVDAFGHLDFAHNNAGVELQATVVDTEEADWEKVIAVNLKGVWLGMKHQIPQMREHGGGSIVNTASAAGLVGMKEIAVYSAAKGGVVQLTKAAALDYAEATADDATAETDYCAIAPASTDSAVPVTNDERSETSQTTDSATSLGSPKRFMACGARSSSWRSSGRMSIIAVRIAAGHTQLTRMASLATSTAAARVSPTTPCLLAM